MEFFERICHGKVVSTRGNRLFVLIDNEPGRESCTGCSLAHSCGNMSTATSRNSSPIEVTLPSGVSGLAEGVNVCVGLRRRSAMMATTVLTAIPLAVLLLATTIAALAGLTEGANAVTAIASVAVYYLFAALFLRHRPSPWILLTDKDCHEYS